MRHHRLHNLRLKIGRIKVPVGWSWQIRAGFKSEVPSSEIIFKMVLFLNLENITIFIN
jgi:hypothetical protein